MIIGVRTAQLTRSPSTAGGASYLAMLLKLVEGKEDPQGAPPGQAGQRDHLLHQRHHLLSQKLRRKEEEREKRRKRKDDQERKRNPKTVRGSALRPRPPLPLAEADPTHVAKLGEHPSQEEKIEIL